MNTKPRKIVTLANSGNELIRAETSCLILGIALILFKGLMTLTTLRALKLTPIADSVLLVDPTNSMTPEMAIRKSTMFHVSLK